MVGATGGQRWGWVQYHVFGVGPHSILVPDCTPSTKATMVRGGTGDAWGRQRHACMHACTESTVQGKVQGRLLRYDPDPDKNDNPDVDLAPGPALKTTANRDHGPDP